MIGKVLHLTPDDDVAGVRDRIEWARADRVALVIPHDHPTPLREVDFDLIRRAGQQYGSEIAIVSPHPRQRELAHGAGLVTFRTIQQAVERRWMPSEDVEPVERLSPPRHFSPNTLRRFFPRRNWLLIGLRVIVALVAIAIVAGAALVIIPSAHVTMVATSQSMSLIVPVTLDLQTDKVDLKAGTIPAQRVDVIIEDQAAAPSTGAKDIPKTKSTGSVILFNELASPYTVPKNTVVRTSSASIAVRFVTLNNVEVPAGGRAEVGIEAIEVGPGGNVPANQINRVEGMPSLYVRVLNTAPTRGGSVETVRAVTQDDYKRARAAVLDQLLQAALDKMKQDPEVARNGWFVVPNTLFIADVQDETYDRFVTEQADEVKLNMRLQVAGYAVSPADLDAVARAAITDNVPEGFNLLEVTTERGDVAEEGTGLRTVFYVVAHGMAGARIDENEVKKLVRGRTIADAQSTLLEALALKGNPVIDVQPEWLLKYTHRLPFVTLRIQTQVKRE
jgi:hypothetical protein